MRDARRVGQIETTRFDLRGDVDDVAHDREQQLVDAADDATVDERIRRRMDQLELDAAILLQDLDIKIRIALEQRPRIVAGRALRQHGQRAAAQQLVQATAAGVAQARDFVARKHIEPGRRRDTRAEGGGFVLYVQLCSSVFFLVSFIPHPTLRRFGECLLASSSLNRHPGESRDPVPLLCSGVLRDNRPTSLCFFTRHPWRASHFSLLAQREVTKRKGTPGGTPPLRGGSLRAAGFR